MVKVFKLELLVTFLFHLYSALDTMAKNRGGGGKNKDFHIPGYHISEVDRENVYESLAK